MAYSLLPAERRALAATMLDSSRPIADVAKRCGLRAHVVRYALHKLQRQQVITPYCFINAEALGLSAYSMLASFAFANRRSHERFMQVVERTPELITASEMSGEYQYRLTFLARNSAHFADVLEGFLSSFPDALFGRVVSVRTSGVLYGRKHLADLKQPPEQLRVQVGAALPDGSQAEAGSAIVQLDELDRKILRALSELGAPSLTALARAIGAPLSTTEFRLKRLRQYGVVLGFPFSLDAQKIGLQEYGIFIFLRGFRAGIMQELERFAERRESVFFMLRAVGSWDVELGVEVSEPEQVSALVSALYEEFGSYLSQVKVCSYLRTVKFSMWADL